MDLTPSQFISLEEAYYRIFPEKIPIGLISTYEGILENKSLIRNANPCKFILNCLLTVAIDKIQKGARFQKITLIKLIRAHSSIEDFDPATVDRLFYVFQSLILEVNEDMCWKLTTTLKNIKLSTLNIEWLIENYWQSEHFVNRLLRYPAPNQLISEWARERIRKRDLEGRESELIGLMLNSNPEYSYRNKAQLLWGIHYSKLNEDKKKELLLKHTTSKSFDELVKICIKNGYSDIIGLYYTNLTCGTIS